MVARITQVALPCELTEKLTGTTVRAQFLQNGIDAHTAPIFYTFFIRKRGEDYCRFSHDVTKIQTAKLLILFIFYFNEV